MNHRSWYITHHFHFNFIHFAYEQWKCVEFFIGIQHPGFLGPLCSLMGKLSLGLLTNLARFPVKILHLIYPKYLAHFHSYPFKWTKLRRTTTSTPHESTEFNLKATNQSKKKIQKRTGKKELKRKNEGNERSSDGSTYSLSSMLSAREEKKNRCV